MQSRVGTTLGKPRHSDDIECGNFKGEIGPRPDHDEKLPALHEVWSIIAAHERGAMIR